MALGLSVSGTTTTITAFSGFSSLFVGGGSVRVQGTASGPGTMTVTATGSPTSNGGPATDFAINPNLNVTTNPTSNTGASVSSANAKMTLTKITDGTSNTIFAGHAYLARAEYPVTAPGGTSLFPIFRGGTLGTARNGLGDTGSTWLQDGATAASNQWGSPMPEGGLMGMADGSVRLISYSVRLTNLLQPNDGNVVSVP